MIININHPEVKGKIRMAKTKWLSLILVIAFVSMSCNLFNPTSNKDGLEAGDAKRVFAEQPVFDLQAPLPSPGAAALRALAGWEPGAADLQGDVEAAERAALSAFIKDLTAQTGSSGASALRGALPALPTVQTGGAKVANPARGSALLASYHKQANTDGPPNTLHDVSLIAGLVTGLSDIISDHMPAGGSVSPSQTTTEGNATTTMSADIGKSTDGGSKFGMGIKTDTVKNGSTTTTDFAASIDGQRCPNAEGQVSFTVKVRLGADSGANAFTQDLTAFVRAVVDDNAEIATTTIDIMENTRQVKNGRNLYIETGLTLKYDGEGTSGIENTNMRLVRRSQDVTDVDVVALAKSSHETAFSMGRTALLVARNNWRDNGCVKIDAASPGKVSPGSTTPIAVTVTHKFDGSTVPSKLEAVLSGEASLTPTTLAKTPGTLTFTAPGENGKSATINLTATSRRGIATLDLTANTGGQSFTLDADSNGAHFSGTICSLDRPFEIQLAASGESWIESATPNSSVNGNLEGTYSVDGCTFTGSGPYNIIKNANGSATLQWTNNWSADCPGLGSKSGSINHELPLQPAPDTACP